MWWRMISNVMEGDAAKSYVVEGDVVQSDVVNSYVVDSDAKKGCSVEKCDVD